MAPKSKSVNSLKALGSLKTEVPQAIPLLTNSNVEDIFMKVAKKFSCEDLAEAVNLREAAFMEMEVVTEVMADPRFADRAKVEKDLADAKAALDAYVAQAIADIAIKNPFYNALKLMAKRSPDSQAIFDEWSREVENVVRAIRVDEAAALVKAQNDLEDLRKTLDPMKEEADKYATAARSKFEAAEAIAKKHGFSFKKPEPVNGKTVLAH